MLVVKQALRAKAVADATLIASGLLNGTHVYQGFADITTEALQAWVTFFLVSQALDPETGFAEEVYQFDVWARTQDKADAVAERLSAIFDPPGSFGGTLAPSPRRLACPIRSVPVPGDVAEVAETGTLHHAIRQFRVATYAA
jgi:hypothetical protein